MFTTKDPTTGTVTIATTRDEVYDLRVKVDAFRAYSGSDEWDLNDAWRQGFNAALDTLTGVRPVTDLDNVRDYDSDEDDLD